MLRVLTTFVLLAFGSVVACTTFDGLQADGLSVPNPNGKNAGSTCTVSKDCKSNQCSGGTCTAVAGSNPNDDIKDGDETDVDCGGSSAPKCAEGKMCKVNDDCDSAACTSGICKAPSPTDGLKNGDETDVDCGGSKAPKCATGKGCATNNDCAKGGCNYNRQCVDAPSCTGHEGGDTCGAGDDGDASAKHESCCTTVKDGSVSIAKYYVTAGRMRAMVTALNGDFKTWAATAKNWDDSWTDELPASMDDALNVLGPNNKRGCSVSQAGQGARTYWQPPIPDIQPDEKNDFPQKVLDEKILNCVPWTMAQAICHYDGGRLATGDEVQNQITNHGTTTYPWGNTPAYQVKGQIEQLVHFYSYQTPNPPADMRTSGDNPLDRSFFIPPPGRRPLGLNKIGVADATGGMLTWVGDSHNNFYWTASWEEHPIAGHDQAPTGPQDWPGNSPDAATVQGGYYGLGVRCAFDNQ
jgi:hypothetical protein